MNFRVSQLILAMLAVFSGPGWWHRRGKSAVMQTLIILSLESNSCTPTPPRCIPRREHSSGEHQERGSCHREREAGKGSGERAELSHRARPFPRVWYFRIFLQAPEILETPRALNRPQPHPGLPLP